MLERVSNVGRRRTPPATPFCFSAARVHVLGKIASHRWARAAEKQEGGESDRSLPTFETDSIASCENGPLPVIEKQGPFPVPWDRDSITHRWGKCYWHPISKLRSEAGVTTPAFFRFQQTESPTTDSDHGPH
jgi:hypothetical protein